MQTVAIIGSAGIPAKYGGFETLAEQLVLNFSENVKARVYCSSYFYEKKEQQTQFANADLVYIPLKANGWQSIFYDCWSILDAIKKVDTIILLGVPGAFILPFIKIFSTVKIIAHLDGLEWKRDKWNTFAKKFLKWSEKIAVKFADICIADNTALGAYVINNYNIKPEIIAYGSDHTFKKLISQELFYENFDFMKEKKYAFGVCRIEPENNIHIILKAFSKLKSKNLVFVGNWKNSDYGKNLVLQYKNCKNITLLDPIYDNEILDRFKSNAFLYIHGHSAGGTNPSLVEAMYATLPIIAFDVSFNRFTTFNKANYFKNEKELILLVTNLKKSELDEKAKMMKQIANENYLWKVIAKQYEKLILSNQVSNSISTKKKVKLVLQS